MDFDEATRLCNIGYALDHATSHLSGYVATKKTEYLDHSLEKARLAVKLIGASKNQTSSGVWAPLVRAAIRLRILSRTSLSCFLALYAAPHNFCGNLHFHIRAMKERR